MASLSDADRLSPGSAASSLVVQAFIVNEFESIGRCFHRMLHGETRFRQIGGMSGRDVREGEMSDARKIELDPSDPRRSSSRGVKHSGFRDGIESEKSPEIFWSFLSLSFGCKRFKILFLLLFEILFLLLSLIRLTSSESRNGGARELRSLQGNALRSADARSSPAFNLHCVNGNYGMHSSACSMISKPNHEGLRGHGVESTVVKGFPSSREDEVPRNRM